MEETTPFIIKDSKNFYKYFYCTRELIDTREFKCDYYILLICCSPFIFLYDLICLFPQCIYNNFVLCR